MFNFKEGIDEKVILVAMFILIVAIGIGLKACITNVIAEREGGRPAEITNVENNDVETDAEDEDTLRRLDGEPDNQGGSDGTATETGDGSDKTENPATVTDSAKTPDDRYPNYVDETAEISETNATMVADAKAQFIRAWGKLAALNPDVTYVTPELEEIVAYEFMSDGSKIIDVSDYANGARDVTLTVSEDDIDVWLMDDVEAKSAYVSAKLRDADGNVRLEIGGLYNWVMDAFIVQSVTEH